MDDILLSISGRILNRFTSDVSTMDESLRNTASELIGVNFFRIDGMTTWFSS